MSVLDPFAPSQELHDDRHVFNALLVFLCQFWRDRQPAHQSSLLSAYTTWHIFCAWRKLPVACP